MKTSLCASAALLCALLFASAALATYSIPISSFGEATGRASAGQYEISFTVGQASPVGTGTSGGFALASGIMPKIMDPAPPVILHTPIPLVAASQAVTVQADIEDAVTGVDSVKLYYHEGGFTTFKWRWMYMVSGTTYEAEIPSQTVTERGVAYYIEAVDGMGNMATAPGGAPDSLQNLPVYFESLVSDINMPSGEYRMISIPGTPTDGSVDSVLVDDYGDYDRKAWRLGRWNAADGCTVDCYDEYPDTEDLEPGKAYWLILKSSALFDVSGVSTDASRPCRIHLDRGWNQIGIPFAFGTMWSAGWVDFEGERYSIGAEHIVGNDTILVENNLIAYDGEYRSFQTHLGVWSGYWVFNASTDEVDLSFPPEIMASGALEAPLAGSGLEGLLGIRVKSGLGDMTSAVRECYAGLADDSRDGWDARDLHAPPPLAGEMMAAFRHGDWGRLSGRYMTDIRPASAEGQSWVVTVETRLRDYVQVEVEQILDLPEGWGVAIYDRARGVKTTDLTRPYTLEVPGRAEVEIVAGTHDFIAGKEAETGVELRTQLLSLSPNPFREDISVSFYLSSPGRVSISIYNIEGALVASLAEGVLDPGIHSREWDGRTQSGSPAASGVYFLRIVTDRAGRTEKIIRLK